MDESFEILDYPNDSKSVSRLRCGIGAVSPYVKFMVRSLPSGGIRLIRSGIWGAALRGTDTIETDTVFPILKHRLARPINGLRPSCFYLGFLPCESLHLRDMPKQARCNVRGCPFPARNGKRCCYHIKQDSLWFVMYGREIDRKLVYGTDENPNPELHTGLWFELQRDDFVFEYKGQKRNDLWHTGSGMVHGFGRRGKRKRPPAHR